MNRRTMLAALALAASAGVPDVCAAPARVRPPAVAGTFYPADPKELAAMVDGFLARAPAAPLEGVVALVAPHAGYVYSGQVAAHSYALLKGRTLARVVVIAPSHVDSFPYAAVYDGTGYATPLGQIPVDTEFAAKLVKAGGGAVRLSSRGHSTSGPQGEHALEVQLPFLQRTVGRFKLVPVIMGDQGYDACRALGLALARLIDGPDTVIVASSDLSHFHSYDEAVKLDRKTLRAIEEWDYLSLSRNFARQIWEACGGGPIVAAMIAAERLGASQAKVLKYANSGDTTGDRSRVVGYGAVAIVKNVGRRAPGATFSLGTADRTQLLAIAKRSVETAVRQGKVYECPKVSEALMQERGAFVTLRKAGQLRGCIGYVAPVKPLGETVRDVAAFAALRDERFRPVTSAELPLLEYEISVLSPLRHVLDVKQIVVGRHGLVMRQRDAEGLLLPQVPVEQGWNRNTFLEQTCVKAGLPPRAWQDPDTDTFAFTALVFGDRAPVSEVEREDPAAVPRAPAPGSPAPSGAPF